MLNEIDQFMDYLNIEKNASENTIEAYNRDMLQLFSFFTGDYSQDEKFDYEIDVVIQNDDVVVQSISKPDIISFIEFLYDRGLKRISIERKIASIKTFFKFLYNRELISSNPAQKIPFPMKESRLPKFLYLKDINKILDFSTENFIDYRDRAILDTFYSTGARVAELVSINLTDTDFTSGRIKVLGKGREERVVFLTDGTSETIRIYLSEREKKFGEISTPLFVNNRGNRITERGVYDIVTKRVKNAGLLESVSPHTFRHSFATEMLSQGADLRVVQELLGHKHLSSTQVYTHTTKKRLKKVYDKYHPHSGEN